METGLTLLLWDVDHTLIENGGASKATYSETFRRLVGRTPAVQPSTHGRTDFQIMENLFKANGENPALYSDVVVGPALIESLQLNRPLLLSKGYALPGAAEVLQRMSEMTAVRQSVLTGNLPQNAIVKLEAFGLTEFLDFEIGGYGSDSRKRFELVEAARTKAERKHGQPCPPERTVLVGDTTRDVEAAKLSGARIIAVATGTHSRSELEEAGADVVLDSLVPIEGFTTALTLVFDQ